MKDINLLPQDMTGSNYANNDSKVGISAKAIIIVILALIVFGATLLLPQMYMRTLRMELSSLKSEVKSEKYDEVKKVKKDLESIDKSIFDKTDIINNIDDTNISVNELITAIKSATPEGCELFTLQIDTKSIRIGGIAPDNLVVAEMVSNLSGLKNLKMSTSVKIDDNNEFTIDVEILGKGK